MKPERPTDVPATAKWCEGCESWWINMATENECRSCFERSVMRQTRESFEPKRGGDRVNERLKYDGRDR